MPTTIDWDEQVAHFGALVFATICTLSDCGAREHQRQTEYDRGRCKQLAPRRIVKGEAGAAGMGVASLFATLFTILAEPAHDTPSRCRATRISNGRCVHTRGSGRSDAVRYIH